MNTTGMGFGMWIFWIILIVVVVFLVKVLAGGSLGQTGTNVESPLETLQKRFASGEIDQEDFERMKEELKK